MIPNPYQGVLSQGPAVKAQRPSRHLQGSGFRVKRRSPNLGPYNYQRVPDRTPLRALGFQVEDLISSFSSLPLFAGLLLRARRSCYGCLVLTSDGSRPPSHPSPAGASWRSAHGLSRRLVSRANCPVRCQPNPYPPVPPEASRGCPHGLCLRRSKEAIVQRCFGSLCQPEPLEANVELQSGPSQKPPREASCLVQSHRSLPAFCSRAFCRPSGIS